MSHLPFGISSEPFKIWLGKTHTTQHVTWAALGTNSNQIISEGPKKARLREGQTEEKRQEKRAHGEKNRKRGERGYDGEQEASSSADSLPRLRGGARKGSEPTAEGLKSKSEAK